MPFELILAFRYLRAGSGGLIRLTAVSAVLGIVLGVGCLIIVQAVYTGFQNGVEKSLLAGQPHITVGVGDGAATGSVVAGTINRIPNVRDVEPVLVRSAIARTEGRNEYALMKVSLKDGAAKGAEIGKQLAIKLNLSVGDDLEVIDVDQTDGARAFETRVARIVETGLYDFDSVILQVPARDFAASDSENETAPNAFLVTLEDPFSAAETAVKIKNGLGGAYKVRDWRSTNQPLFAALNFERRTAFVVFALMVLISAFGITATLSLLVAERRMDIALLRTCGASSRSLVMLFFVEGAVLGLAGVAGGVILGLVGCFGANYFGLTDIAPQVYSLSGFRLEPTLNSVLIIIFVSFCVVLTAVFIPAFRATKSKPLELLRNL